jgi:transcription termination factor Rho
MRYGGGSSKMLIDERSEEVTEMHRTIQAEVIASSSDRDATEHARLAAWLSRTGRPSYCSTA